MDMRSVARRFKGEIEAVESPDPTIEITSEPFKRIVVNRKNLRVVASNEEKTGRIFIDFKRHPQQCKIGNQLEKWGCSEAYEHGVGCLTESDEHFEEMLGYAEKLLKETPKDEDEDFEAHMKRLEEESRLLDAAREASEYGQLH